LLVFLRVAIIKYVVLWLCESGLPAIHLNSSSSESEEDDDETRLEPYDYFDYYINFYLIYLA
jgi:hypothetical protein